jgi:hypothetical protein
MRDMWMACADGAVGTTRGACEDLAGGVAGDSWEIEERLRRRGRRSGGWDSQAGAVYTAPLIVSTDFYEKIDKK